jgi:hypothetical protein
VEQDGKLLRNIATHLLTLQAENGETIAQLTTSREVSLAQDKVELLGLDHPRLAAYMEQYRNLPPQEVGIRVKATGGRKGVLSIWQVMTRGDRGETRTTILPLAVDLQGKRSPSFERQIDGLFQRHPATSDVRPSPELLTQYLEPMIHRELLQRGTIGESRAYDARLIGWVEIA